MKRLLCPTLPKPGHPVELPEDESKHATLVLRLSSGDSIELMDGKGNSVLATLSVRGKSVFVEHAGETATTGKSTAHEVLPVTLELALIKGDAMEWAIEKAVELGVKTLIPTLTAHSVVQIDRKGPQVFQERWQKIADQALKQCGRLSRMEVLLPTKLEQLLVEYPGKATEPRLMCDESSRGDAPYLPEWLSKQSQGGTSNVQGIRILIGPEGGWNEKERLLLSGSCIKISLGPLVLRAETAAVFASSLATAHLRMVLRCSDGE